MKRTSFNSGWTFRARKRSFIETPELGEPWQPVALPHDAMLTAPRDPAGEADSGYFPGGVWEYRTRVDAPADLAQRHLVLEFEGVYRDAVVELNGDVIARNAYGYSQFHVALDAWLRTDEDNVLRVEATAGGDSRWYSGAGIYRPVHLLSSGLVYIAPGETRVTSSSITDEDAVVQVHAQVESVDRRVRTVEAHLTLTGPDGSAVSQASTVVTVSPGEPAVLTQRLLVAHPQRWDVDAPHLYQCHVELRDGETLDEETTTFGIRSLELDARHGLRINGRTVTLRGACVHHDNGVLGAATIDRADERRVELLKAAGFNALRSAHNPMSRSMLAACDRLGMLVMDEAFDTWTRPKRDHDYAKDFRECWEQDLLAMVRKDVNSPSVIMYSIGNEIPEIGTPSGRQWNRRLVARLRAADPTRPITNGVNAWLTSPGEIVEAVGEALAAQEGVEDYGVNAVMSAMFSVQPKIMVSEYLDERTSEAFDALDAAGYNYLHDRYVMDGELHPNRVIVGTEVMPASVATSWEQIQGLDYLIGDFCWTGWDYLGEAGIGRISYDPEDGGEILNAFPHLTATSGDIDITGRRLPISYYRETVYGLRDQPYVVVQDPAHHGRAPRHRSPWSWTDSVPTWTWPGKDGEPIKVTVYSSAEEVELVVNGRALGRRRVGEDRPCLVDVDLPYETGELLAVAYTAGVEVGRSGLRSATDQVLVKVVPEADGVRADDTDLAYVWVLLTDEHGTPQPGSDRAVEVSVSGPGALQGLGTGRPSTEERFDDSRCTTYQGRALAVVRPHGPGTITLTVSGEGCAPVTTQIRAG